LTSNLKSGLTFNKVLLFNMGLKSIHGFIVKTLNTTQEKKKIIKISKSNTSKKYFMHSQVWEISDFLGGKGSRHCAWNIFFFCRSVVFELRVKWEFNQLKLLEEADIGCTVLTGQSAKVGEGRGSGLKSAT